MMVALLNSIIIWALEVLLGIAHSQSVANCIYRIDISMNEAVIVQNVVKLLRHLNVLPERIL